MRAEKIGPALAFTALLASIVISSSAVRAQAIKVTTSPVAGPWVPLLVAQEKGYFRDEGLDVVIEMTPGGAATVPTVVSGNSAFGSSNYISLLSAITKGLPVKAVAPVAEGPDAIVVLDDSEIKSVRDLAGKRVAVNTLGNIGQMAVNAVLDEVGTSRQNVRFVELPFPNMLQALEAKQVDAVWLVEPFVGMARSAGRRVLATPFDSIGGNKGGLQIGAYFTSDAFAKQNPETVKKFVKAVSRGHEYAAAHADEMRELTAKNTKMKSEVVAAMRLPAWRPKLSLGTLNKFIDLSAKYSFIEKAVPAADLLDPNTPTEN